MAIVSIFWECDHATDEQPQAERGMWLWAVADFVDVILLSSQFR
jgi:hypothetical protein